jgi:hypothetical protein
MQPWGVKRAVAGVENFLLGMLFGRMASHQLYREETVMLLEAGSKAGCSGYAGAATLYLGHVREQTDGRYLIACGDRLRVSAEVQVVCSCP